jgi:hypothetical protein
MEPMIHETCLLSSREEAPFLTEEKYNPQCPACSLNSTTLPSLFDICGAANDGCQDCQVIIEGIDASGHIVGRNIYTTGYIPVIAKDAH